MKVRSEKEPFVGDEEASPNGKQASEHADEQSVEHADERSVEFVLVSHAAC